MSTPSQLVAAIEARLNDRPLLDEVEVLVEDPNELEARIDKALSELGLAILIGKPRWVNTTPQSTVANMEMVVPIALGENPTLWRDEAHPNRPTCDDAAWEVTLALQGMRVIGFQPLSVTGGDPVDDKARALYEVSVRTKAVVTGK